MLEPEVRDGFEKILCTHMDISSPNIRMNKVFVTKPTRIGNNEGNSILLCGKRKSYFPFHCIVGPDWPMLLLVYTLILIPNLVILPIVSSLGIPVVVIGSIGFVGLLYFYSATSCSDPGIIYDEGELNSSQSSITLLNNTHDQGHHHHHNDNNNTSIFYPQSMEHTESPSHVITNNTVHLDDYMKIDTNSDTYSNDDIENQQHNREGGGEEVEENSHNLTIINNGNHHLIGDTSLDRQLINTIDHYDNNNHMNTVLTSDSDAIILSGIPITTISTTTTSNTNTSTTTPIIIQGTVIASSTTPLSNTNTIATVTGIPTTSTTTNNNSNINNSSNNNHNNNNNGANNTMVMECGRCQVKRPYTARHCTMCGVCIDQLDHHCPWCGKCIGKKNMIYFRIFIGFLCFQCYFLIGSLLYYLIGYVGHINLPQGPSV